MIRLETERMLFRDHEPDDLESYCEMESDAIYRWPQVVHPRAELERSFLEVWMKRRDFGLHATILKEDGRYIGRCGLYPFRNEHGEVQPNEAFIAFYLARPYWGRGLATEAGKAWVAHGFANMGLRRIVGGVAATNVASRRVLEKLGFRWLRSGGEGGTHWHDFELRNLSTSR